MLILSLDIDIRRRLDNIKSVINAYDSFYRQILQEKKKRRRSSFRIVFEKRVKSIILDEIMPIIIIILKASLSKTYLTTLSK